MCSRMMLNVECIVLYICHVRCMCHLKTAVHLIDALAMTPVEFNCKLMKHVYSKPFWLIIGLCLWHLGYVIYNAP